MKREFKEDKQQREWNELLDTFSRQIASDIIREGFPGIRGNLQWFAVLCRQQGFFK